MSENLGLLQNLVSASDIANEVDDYDESSNFFSFTDFEKDLDFINQHLEDDEQPHEVDETQVNDTAESNKEERDANCVSYENNISPKNDEDDFEVNPCNKKDAQSFECEESYNTKVRLGKKVSFDLPDVHEYSDDFESSSEEQEEDKEPNKLGKELCEEGKINDIDHKPSNSQVLNVSNTTSEIKTCATCNCRLTRMHILDLTDLNNLFVMQGKKSERKLMRKRSGRRKNTQSELHRCDEKVDNIDKNRDDMKKKKKPPLETFWPKSSNSSLLGWLKIKKKEERVKRSAKRKEKKEEKLAKRQEEIAKLDRKEVSDRKVLEWMKKKRKEKRLGKLFEGRVAPVSDDCLVQDSSTAPNGYAIVDSFEMKKPEEPKLEEKEKGRSGDTRKCVVNAKKSKHKEATKSPSEDGKSKSRNGAIKSYDEWLKEKNSSFIVDKAKHENKNVNDDTKIYMKERLRRQEVKNTSRQKVDSNLTSKLKRGTNENSSSNQHKSELAKDTTQQYRWAYKLSNPESQETSTLKLHNVSMHNSVQKKSSKGTVSNAKIVGCILENGSDVTNTMRSTKLEEVS